MQQQPHASPSALQALQQQHAYQQQQQALQQQQQALQQQQQQQALQQQAALQQQQQLQALEHQNMVLAAAAGLPPPPPPALSPLLGSPSLGTPTLGPSALGSPDALLVQQALLAQQLSPQVVISPQQPQVSLLQVQQQAGMPPPPPPPNTVTPDIVHSPNSTKRIYIDTLLDNDILCGRGGKSNHHPGNKRYRKVVRDFKQIYRAASQKAHKTDLSRAIVQHCVQQGGRFVKQEGNRYYVLTQAEARKKTSQALRETKDLRQGGGHVGGGMY